MCNFFKKLCNFFKPKEKDIFPTEPIKEIPEIEETPEVCDNPEDNNQDLDKPDDGGKYKIFSGDEKKLYYPKAIRSELELRTRGFYTKKYPLGAVIHFTAGRSRNNKEGNKRNANTHLEMGERSITAEASKGSYAYLIIDRSGNVHQNFPLNRWGYHAGKSAWKGLTDAVSDDLVGIEVQCAGRLSDYYLKKYKCPEGQLAAWYTSPNSGDKFFDKIKECRYSEDKDNIQKGWYHSFSPEQEKALLEVLLWMKYNNPEIFEFKHVLGHDEVSGIKGIGYNRKEDPGASLSITMTEFRKKLEEEYLCLKQGSF